MKIGDADECASCFKEHRVMVAQQVELSGWVWGWGWGVQFV